MVHKKEEYKEGCYGDEVREHLLEFAEKGFDSIPEEERDAWFSRFKFWGLFHQRSGQESFFMMRLTNASGVLDPGQLRAIAEVADEFAQGPVENPEFGNGWFDLTTRQSVQLHWIRLEDVPAVWDKLESAGVTTRSAGGDTMRNISGGALAGKIEEKVDSLELLERFQEELRGDNELANMPRKFNISVTGSLDGASQDAINDIGFEPAEKEIDGETVLGFNVVVGGGTGGRQPRAASPLDIFVRPENAYDVGRAFVELYHDHGRRDVRSKNRSRFFVEDWGEAKIRKLLQEEYVDFGLHTSGEDFAEEYTYNAGRPPGDGRGDYVGVGDQKDGSKFVGLSVPIGRIPAKHGIALADLADEYGSGEVRLTRRQNLIITDVDPDDIDDLLAEPMLEQYQPEPNPFHRGAMACTGTEFCSLALTETKARMARMLRWLHANVELPDDVEHIHMHYSGCTADCGQAQTADIGLQGMRARKNGEMVEAFDIGVGGGIGENPSFVEWIRQRVPADEAPAALKGLLEAFAAHRDEGQSFRQWVEATGTEALIEFCEPAETDFEAPYMDDGKQNWYPFAEGDQPAETIVGASVASDD